MTLVEIPIFGYSVATLDDRRNFLDVARTCYGDVKYSPDIEYHTEQKVVIIQPTDQKIFRDRSLLLRY